MLCNLTLQTKIVNTFRKTSIKQIFCVHHWEICYYIVMMMRALYAFDFRHLSLKSCSTGQS